MSNFYREVMILEKETFAQELIDDNDRLMNINEQLEERNEYLEAENERLKAAMEQVQKDMENLKSEYNSYEELVKNGAYVILKRLANINGDEFHWITNEAWKRMKKIEGIVDPEPVRQPRRRGYERKAPVDAKPDLEFLPMPDRVLNSNVFEDRVIEESISIVARLSKMNKTDIPSMVKDFYTTEIPGDF
jgi:FtsZ-binding cell division protein ZapB